MKTFIAYFDHLGFKDFIERNDFEIQKKGVGNILRDIENAAADGKLKDAPYGVVADLSATTIQVLNFSDTILFWTPDDSEDSLLELLKVTYRYNWGATTHFFPARGALAYGEIQHLNYDEQNQVGGGYYVNSIFGQGLVDVYQKAEASNWSGATIDSSILKKMEEMGLDIDTFLQPYAKKYDVPYKNDNTLNEYAFDLVKKGTLNDEGFKNVSNSIRENFASYNKRVDSEGVQKKIQNTIDFLESYKNQG